MTTRLCVFVFPFIFSILNCSSAKQTETPPQHNQIETQSTDKYQTIAEEKYHGGVNFLFNGAKTHVLCVKEEKETANPGFASTRFFVYDLKAERVIFEDAPGRATVKWISQSNIEVAVVPGIVKADESAKATLPGYVYDCQRQRKTGRSTLNHDR